MQSPLQTFTGHAENTMNRYTQASVAAAIQLLVKNHQPLEHSFAAFSDDLITHKIIAPSEEPALLARLERMAKREQVGLDVVGVYNGSTTEKIQLPMRSILNYLLVAIQDQDQFSRSTYPDRLRTLYRLIQEIDIDSTCNVGVRNELIKMLHDDYAGVFIITECKSSLRDQAQRFYEAKFLAQEPELAFTLLNEWITAALYDPKKKTPNCDDFFADAEELRTHLNASLLRSGLNPAGNPLKEYVDELVNTRDVLPPPSPIEQQVSITAFTHLLNPKIPRSRGLLAALADCKKLEDIKQKGLDLYCDLARIQNKARTYTHLLAIGEVEGNLVQKAKQCDEQIAKYLQEENREEWASLRDEVDRLEQELDQSITAAMQPDTAVLRDSFSILATTLEANPENFSVLVNKFKSLFKTHKLALLDETQLRRWADEHIAEEGQAMSFNLTPLSLNRLCWQALTTSPTIWPKSFTKIMREAVIPMINGHFSDASPDQLAMLSFAFPETLQYQLEWLTAIAEGGTKQFDTIPKAYVRCDLSDLSYTEEITTFEDLESLLKSLLDCVELEQRETWIEKICENICWDKVQDGDQLAKLMKLVPESHRADLIGRFLGKIQNSTQLDANLALVPSSQRMSIRAKYLLSSAIAVPYSFSVSTLKMLANGLKRFAPGSTKPGPDVKP